MFAEILFSPKPYFAERIKYPTVKWQLVIVILVAVATNIWRVALIAPLGAAALFVDDAIILFSLWGLGELVFIWIVVTGLMHLMAMVLGGESRYNELLRVTGFGFLPIVIAGVIRSVGYYLSLSSATPPEPPRGGGFEASLGVWNDFVAQTAGDAIVLGALVVGSVFVVVAGYLWLIGVTVATDLDTDRASAVASAGTLLVVLWWLQPILL